MQVHRPYLQQHLLVAVLHQQLYGALASSAPVLMNKKHCTAGKSSSKAPGIHGCSNEHMQAAVEMQLKDLDPCITHFLQKGVLAIEDLLVLLPEHRTIKSYKRILVKHMESTSHQVRMQRQAFSALQCSADRAATRERQQGFTSTWRFWLLLSTFSLTARAVNFSLT